MSGAIKEIGIIGGGLAGLSLSILAAKQGWKVTLIEKGSYPRQKVCGEYISLESYEFLEKLGLDLQALSLPFIHKFTLTTQHGITASTSLTTGGFGLSRWFLDKALYAIALNQGVRILCQTKVTQVTQNSTGYEVTFQSGSKENYPLLVGAFGRISGLQKPKGKNEFVGVKYHIAEGPADDTIEIHQFEGGYCGVSKVEEGAYNLCYLVSARYFKTVKGDIGSLEKEILSQNPFLKKRLESKRLTPHVFTSQIHFGTQNSQKQGYILLGDAAGFIPPLTGNGMSLAFRSASKLFESLLAYEKHGQLSQVLTENHAYIQQYLRFRIIKGRFLQSLLFIPNRKINRILCYALVYVPGLLKLLSKQAVGKKIEAPGVDASSV